MRRVAIIIAAVSGGLIAAAALAWMVLFHTPPGRSFLKAVIEEQLGGALNSTAHIGSLEGALPGQIIAGDIVLSGGERPWLTAEKLELRWRPFALVNKRVFIDDVSLTGGRLLGDPPPSDAPKDQSRQIRIPEIKTHIDIAKIAIQDFEAEVNGARQRLNASGAIRLHGPDISIALHVTSASGADEADIIFNKSPDTGAYKLDATINAQAGGAIATLLDLQGPAQLRAASDGQLNATVTSISGTMGYYGDFAAEISSDLSNFEGADILLAFTPGARFDGISELSAPVSLNARYDTQDRGGALNIASLKSSMGEINGRLDWRAPRGVIETLNADLNAALDEAYLPTVQEIAGTVLAVKTTLNWRRDDYTFAGTVSGPMATLTVKNGVTDLRRTITGETTLDATPRSEGAFWLENGLTVEGNLVADLIEDIVLNNATAVTGDGSRFAGEGGYGLNDKTARAKGDIILKPDLFAKLIPGAIPVDDITGDIDLNGPLERFTLTAALEAPALTIGKGSLPPLSVEIALSGLPRLPTGDVSARASNGAPRRLDAQFRSSDDGTIRIPQLSYGGRGFALDGSAQINPDRQTVGLDLIYKGEDDAEPWPGFIAEGNLTAKGVLSRDGALTRLTAETAAFAVNGLAVEGATLTAEGPPGAIRVRLASEMVRNGQSLVLADVAASGQVDARAAPIITLNAFSALLSDNRLTLTQPATIKAGDSVEIENLAMTYGAGGAVSLDATISPARWRANVSLVNINIPGADGQITGKLAIDTDAAAPGSGEFRLRTLLLTEEEQASISLRAVWNGEVLQLTDLENGPALDMDIRLPAKLIKSPSIKIDTSGALSGRAKYTGAVEAIAAYLPPVMQSLEGDLSADFTFAGDLAEPVLSGSAALSGGAYSEVESGFSLAGLHAQAQAAYGRDNSKLTFTGGARGANQSREDTLTFTGDVTLGENSNINFAAKLDGAEFSAAPVNMVRASGELTISGPPEALVAKGDIAVTELDAEIVTPESTGLVDIDVIAIDDVSGPGGNEPRQKSGLDFEIRLHANSRVFIRGRGLESEWSADVTAIDGREAPLILGAMSLRRGWLDFSGRRFTLTRGSVDFDRLAVNDPRLDIRAELQTSDGVTAIILVSGRASEPNVELTSTPSLPSEDVMSLILFGKPAQNLTAFESLQTAEALASLGGIGPFGGEGVTGRLRRSVGLDLLNFDIDPENGGGSLTVGKYVAEGFFVTASQDAQGRNGSVSVKYEITDNITVETEIEQEGDQTLSANWKKDF